MQIARLSIKDYFGIEALDFRPGKINMIEGGNGQGKTAVLEAIEKGITNKDRRSARTVRDGADRYIILIEMDDGTVIRRAGAGGSAPVDVKSEDGVPRRSPQDWLNSIAGAYAFNPVDFVTEKPERQKDMLLSMLPIQVAEEEVQEWLGFVPQGINYNAHGLTVCKKLYDVLYEMRRQANSEVKALEGQLKVESAKVPKGFDAQAYRGQDLTEKVDQLAAAQEHNKEIDRIRDSIPSLEAEIRSYGLKNETLQARLDELKRQMAEIVKQMAANNREAEAVRGKIAATEESLAGMAPIDTTAFQEEIREFQHNQTLVSLVDRCEEIRGGKAEADEKASALDAQVEMLKRKPQELLTQMGLPVQGLGIDGDQVTINGRPVINLSTSERIALALDIARASAGELKVICVDRYESLDKEAKAEFMRQAEGDGFQYFVTIPTEGPLQVNLVQD